MTNKIIFLIEKIILPALVVALLGMPSLALHAQEGALETSPAAELENKLQNDGVSNNSNDINSLSGFQSIPAIPALTVTQNSKGGQDYTITLQILILMTLLSFLPALLIMMTSFTRIIIVFAILRQALGLQQSPSNQILIGISLFMTLFIMSPVIKKISINAYEPYVAEQITAKQALSLAKAPLHEFMIGQTRESDLGLFFRVAGMEKVVDAQDIPLSILIPAFVTSELKTAFQIGFIIFIPFLVIDIVVASVLMAMGMMMLSPLIISLPFKIMLFVLVDGWGLIIGTLAASFGV